LTIDECQESGGDQVCLCGMSESTRHKGQPQCKVKFDETVDQTKTHIISKVTITSSKNKDKLGRKEFIC
jgi:hypothetical protein